MDREMHFVVQELRVDDAEQVAELIPQLTKNVLYPEELVQRLRLMAAPNNFQYFVAMQEDAKIIGFGGLVWYPIPSKGYVGSLQEVVTREGFRGRGVMTKILDRIDQLVVHMGIVQVHLEVGNPDAESLYLSRGYVSRGQKAMIKRYS